MRDISGKQITLRTAKAIGVVLCSPETVEMIKKDELPKGNLFDVARAAGFLAAKNTSNLIPHCHPVGIDGMKIEFEFININKHKDVLGKDLLEKSGVVIHSEAKSIGRTGIEIEVLTGLSVSALVVYDLLKPVDKNLEITSVKLLEKKGGKSDRQKFFNTSPTCAILVCSDSTAEGKREDSSGILIREMLENVNASVVDYKIVPDNADTIQQQILQWVEKDIHFVFTTGGTGLGPRDNTVSAVKEILERDADGITEAMRSYGQMRTPLAMMSRAVAGSIKSTTIITLPGSSGGARESLEAILPAVFHARKMLKGGGH
ncbi:MAG TPA: bifunctional molybdenum cofactor biosynthesis protein MoaC/MoaB [Cytophagales bacterium]|nr:bifunctional molybdenum cofactor biosynthesis protein MoaC/MoaB [Cytophagales bacterium]